jgi:SH3-like domain-containing protein
MQRLIAPAIALGLSLLFVVAPCAAEERFPYSAFIVVDEAAVRSGPGETFYPVLNLNRGDAVEVWRHDPDGWCAIRPPEGSFSWVSGDFIESTDGRTGTVVGNQVNVRVGTRFSDVRDVVQLQLNAGEQVHLFDARLLPNGDRMTTWYKIAPPAGEFRWVRERDLTNDAAAVPTPTVQAASFSETVDAAPLHLDALPADAPTNQVLNELEIALSQMVAAEPTAWHFADLKLRGEALVERAETAVERSRVRQFLGKLARFADIQRRYAGVAELRTQTAAVDHALATSAPAAEPKTALDGSTDTSRYDGVGRLTQIVLRDDGATNYALSDARGEIIAYLSSAPGVNLRQYAGLEVGVNGIRGFVTEQRLPQITVKRVDVLSSRAVR